MNNRKNKKERGVLVKDTGSLCRRTRRVLVLYTIKLQRTCNGIRRSTVWPTCRPTTASRFSTEGCKAALVCDCSVDY